MRLYTAGALIAAGLRNTLRDVGTHRTDGEAGDSSWKLPEPRVETFPAEREKKPTPKPPSPNTLRLANPCNSVEGGGGGGQGWPRRDPVSAAPRPTGSSRRPGGCGAGPARPPLPRPARRWLPAHRPRLALPRPAAHLCRATRPGCQLPPTGRPAVPPWDPPGPRERTRLAFGWVCFLLPLTHFIRRPGALCPAGAERGFWRVGGCGRVGKRAPTRGSRRSHPKRIPRPLARAGRGACDHTRASRLATPHPHPSPEGRAGARRGVGHPLAPGWGSHPFSLTPQARPTSGSARAAFSRGWDPAGTALGTRSTRSNAPSARLCDQLRAGRASWLRLSPQRCLNALRPCRGCSRYQPPPGRKLLDTVI